MQLTSVCLAVAPHIWILKTIYKAQSLHEKPGIATLRKLPLLKKIQGQCTNSKFYDQKETEYLRWISVGLQGYMKIQLLEPG